MLTTSYHWRHKQKFSQIALPFFSGVLVIVLTIFVLIPQTQNILKDRQELSDMQQTLQRLSEKAVMLQNLDAAELEIRYQKLNKALPSHEDLGYFMAISRSLAHKSSVEFKGATLFSHTGDSIPTSDNQKKPLLNPESPKAKPKKQKSNIAILSVVLEGQLSDLQTFLLEAERSIPLLQVQEFTFSKNINKLEYGARVSLAFYFSPPPATIGKPSRPLQVITASEDKLYQEITNFQELETIDLPKVPVGNKSFML